MVLQLEATWERRWLRSFQDTGVNLEKDRGQCRIRTSDPYLVEVVL